MSIQPAVRARWHVVRTTSAPKHEEAVAAALPAQRGVTAGHGRAAATATVVPPAPPAGPRRRRRDARRPRAPIIGSFVPCVRSRWPSLGRAAVRTVHVCDGNSGRPIPASMGGPPVQRLCRLPCRARHPHTLATGVVDSSRCGRPAGRRRAADSHGGRRAGTRQAKAKLSPSRPITAARPAGRPHVLLAFPAPTAVSSPPPTHPSVAPPNLQSSRDIFFLLLLLRRTQPPIYRCAYGTWVVPSTCLQLQIVVDARSLGHLCMLG